MSPLSDMPVFYVLCFVSAFDVSVSEGTSQSLTSIRAQVLMPAAQGHNAMSSKTTTSFQPSARSSSSNRQEHEHVHRHSLHRRSIQLSTLPVTNTSLTSGYVTSPFCDIMKTDSCEIDASYIMVLPYENVMLISFPVFKLKWSWLSTGLGFVELSAKRGNDKWNQVWRHKTSRKIMPHLYYTTMRVRLYIPPRDTLTDGFKMVFSFHPISQTPPETGGGIFNCSVPFYDSFKQHFECNLEVECPSGKDEGSFCPYSTDECQGNVAVDNKCYFHVRHTQTLRWTTARRECQKQGGDLATVKSPDQWKAFLHLLHSGHIVDPVYVGLHSYESSMPSVYKNSFIWVDGSVNHRYGTQVRKHKSFFHRFCFMYNPSIRKDNGLFLFWFTYIPCSSRLWEGFICEITIRNITSSSQALLFPPADVDRISHNASQELIKCPGSHVSHSFLSCDPNSKCGTDHYVSKCTVSDGEDSQEIEMFACAITRETLPFTLVCDFRQDCADGSDETFCIHKKDCMAFPCHNGQCISKNKHCNVVKDCWDGSDELCTFCYNLYDVSYFSEPPAIMTFDNSGSLLQQFLRSCEDCPETHFCCPDRYCVPLFCRCNGIGDCQGKEDEADCDMYQCPGLFRCRSSSVCVHADHLCDGWPQCPQHDDEWLCNATCPEGCLCQGHAFHCSKPFSPVAFPNVRYLDATDSGMMADNVTNQMYLVWLSLAGCSLRAVTMIDLPNLRSFSLSYNQISSLNIDIFIALRNLQTLDLSNNPLTLVVSHLSNARHKNLQSIDFSGNQMKLFNTTILSNFPMLRTLNISGSTLTGISVDGFKRNPNLVRLDMRGSRISEYPPDVFQSLRLLQTVWADNYKLCCKDLLPLDFDEKQCFAPVDEVSSCEELLRSDSYRAFLWLFSILSLVGNLGCLVTRLFLLKSRSLTAFSLFVTNLSIADLLMGIYLALVGVADHISRGEYFWYEKNWKSSIACQIAGFLSFLSNETSAFIICLITLDRFLVLSSPFSDFHFKRRTAGIVCVVAWILGFCFAAVPLLPMTREWQFYSQTGICIPLPITRKTFKGRNYAFSVMIIFNLVLFLLIATGQAMIYWTIRTTSMAQSSTRKTKDLTIARNLLSVVISDFLCWFPIGLLGILSASGVPVPGEVNVGMAIFVLPLNSALNPFLYTFKALTERWKRIQETQLLRQLEARSPALQGK